MGYRSKYTTNCCHSVYLLKDKIKPLLGASVYIGSSKAKAESPTELISQVKQGGGLLLSMSDKNSEGFYKFFAMFGGKTSKEALVNWNRFIG